MEELLSRCPRWVLPGRGRPALCAVSGGLDSMCLLDLLDRWCRERDGRVVAAHFNHQLRGAEADRDETFVRDWCAAHEMCIRDSCLPCCRCCWETGGRALRGSLPWGCSCTC